MKQNILLVDDEPATLFGFSRYLTAAGYYVKGSSTLGEAKQAIAAERFDAVILDLILPDGNGIDWIEDLRESHPYIAIVVITGGGDIPLAVDAIRRGADNFLTKPVSLPDLDVFLRKCLELGGLRRKSLTEQRLSERVQPYFGESDAMRKVVELASLAAESDSAVLIQGETGTGKGLIARWIHDHGLHSSGPFVEVNCSSLKGDLLASELFGHVKGAFTSAVQDKQGLVEIADGGTLFLDEIGDMDIAVQSQFLKVIEEKHYRRVGDVRARRSDFRVITATNRDILEETRSGQFRRDLFFRVSVFPIAIPSLRERQEDLPGLIHHILKGLRAPHTEVTTEVAQMLQAYQWPGNIRELKNVLERAVLIARGNPLRPEHFPGLTSDFASLRSVKGINHNLVGLEEDYVRAVVERSKGDMKEAAQAMGVSRATLYRKLKKFKKPQ